MSKNSRERDAKVMFATLCVLHEHAELQRKKVIELVEERIGSAFTEQDKEPTQTHDERWLSCFWMTELYEETGYLASYKRKERPYGLWRITSKGVKALNQNPADLHTTVLWEYRNRHK